MQSSNSGNLAVNTPLVTTYIPAAVIIAVAVLVLYIITAVTAGRPYLFAIQFVVGIVLGIQATRAVIDNHSSYARWLTIGLIGVAPAFVLIFLGITSHDGEVLVMHGTAHITIAGIFYSLVLICVENSAGFAPTVVDQLKTAYSLKPPYIDRQYVRKRLRQIPFSNDGILALAIAGVVVFLGADLLRVQQEAHDAIISPVPFALAYMACLAGLISLSGLAKRLYAIPGHVTVSHGFLSSWISAMFIVLAICGLVAALLPKRPVQYTGSAIGNVVRAHIQQAQQANLQQAEPPPPPDANSHKKPLPILGFGTSKHGYQAMGSLTKSHVNTPLSPLGVLYHAATMFEKTPPTKGADKSPGNGSSPSEGSGMDEGTQGQPPPSTAKGLLNALKGHPDRIMKLSIVLLIVAGILLALILVFRRYLWAIIQPLWLFLADRTRRVIDKFFGPYLRRRAEQRHAAAIERIIAEMPDPFDEALVQTEQPTERLISEAYDSFLAYLWLCGFTRKESETPFDFAQRLCSTARLNEQMIWTITRTCVQSYFSENAPSPDELVQLATALRQLTEHTRQQVKAELLEDKMAQYRMLLAERKLAGHVV